MELKEGDFKVIIYYKGAKHPTIIERDSHLSSVSWVMNRNNINHFKGCNIWQIQDNKGNMFEEGTVKEELKIVTK
jgi:hypothetical protein